jgi:vacuolar-type H+-ATPase subunit C/Vma6
MEIKNIRVILTSRRNGLSQTQAREMTRINYLTWR